MIKRTNTYPGSHYNGVMMQTSETFCPTTPRVKLKEPHFKWNIWCYVFLEVTYKELLFNNCVEVTTLGNQGSIEHWTRMLMVLH